MEKNSSKKINEESNPKQSSKENESQNWEDAKKKIVSGFNVFKEKVKEIGTTVKEKYEEKKIEKEEKTIDKKLIEKDYPVAYCVACGNELGPELAIKLNEGNPVVCETCGVVMKKDESK